MHGTVFWDKVHYKILLLLLPWVYLIMRIDWRLPSKTPHPHYFNRGEHKLTKMLFMHWQLMLWVLFLILVVLAVVVGMVNSAQRTPHRIPIPQSSKRYKVPLLPRHGKKGVNWDVWNLQHLKITYPTRRPADDLTSCTMLVQCRSTNSKRN